MWPVCSRSVGIMDPPSSEDVRMLVESAREEVLMERRRQNLVVDRR